jgi:hypothetical protein
LRPIGKKCQCRHADQTGILTEFRPNDVHSLGGGHGLASNIVLDSGAKTVELMRKAAAHDHDVEAEI